MRIVYPKRSSIEAQKKFRWLLISINNTLGRYLSHVASLDRRKTVKVKDFEVLSKKRGLFFFLDGKGKVQVESLIVSKVRGVR